MILFVFFFFFNLSNIYAKYAEDFLPLPTAWVFTSSYPDLFLYRLPAFVSFVTTMTTVGVLRLLSPRFGQLIAERAKRNGYLRYIHSRVIQNAEEIAFYGGEKVNPEDFYTHKPSSESGKIRDLFAFIRCPVTPIISPYTSIA